MATHVCVIPLLGSWSSMSPHYSGRPEHRFQVIMEASVRKCTLILPYLILTAVDHLGRGSRLQPRLPGRISLALVFLFTGLGHFTQPEAMAQRTGCPWASPATTWPTGTAEE
jgi:hypothetical protein